MSETVFTQLSKLDQSSEGYIVIAPLSNETRQKIRSIQAEYVELLGEENVWIPQNGQLHITFSHLITPGVEYAEESAILFKKVYNSAVTALNKTIVAPFSITSRFDRVEAFPSSIILRASDDGAFNRLREQFIGGFAPPKGTRMPPEIVHTTLLRFKKAVDFSKVQTLTQEIMNEFEPFDEQTTVLQMIHEKKIFVQEHEVIEEFPPAS